MKLIFGAAFFLFAGFALGQQASPGQQDLVAWLQRVAEAARKLSYSGTFVYRNGSQSETSRIVHVASNGNQMEKLEVLDGSPREVIRFNDEVKCYLPENRLVIIEQHSARRSFPALLSSSPAGLSDHYIFRRGGSARIAGMETQILRLEPRDNWRYGHQLWIDGASGLLLKAELFDERGETLESMAFTELRVGEPASAEALMPSAAIVAQKDAWQVRQAKSRDQRDDARWIFRADLPGYRRLAAMRRNMMRDAAPEEEVRHWLYSDGLAALSVFISPARGNAGQQDPEIQLMGAISIARRIVDGHQIVVMGDVPPVAVRRFVDGIGMREK